MPDHNYSEEIDEVMGKMPSWVIRYGISCVAIIVIVLIGGTFFFRYPDVVKANVMISTINPPVKIIARSSGTIQQMFVVNNEMVKPGQTLCILSNPANFKDITAIAALLSTLDTSSTLEDKIMHIEIPSDLQLGELQSEYISCYQAINDYRFFIGHNSYMAKIGHLKMQASLQGKLGEQLKSKDITLSELLRLQNNRYLNDSSLVRDKVITMVEFETFKKNLLDQKISSADNAGIILESLLQQKEYEKNISETELARQNEENILQQKLKDAIRKFKGDYAIWQQEYVIKSPVTGKVAFFKYWKENQYVVQGDGVFMIIPAMQDYIVRGSAGINSAGKIMVGQRIFINLYSYPSDEYGVLTGRIVSRSLVPMDSLFAIEITLTNGLVTNSMKHIPPQIQLEGEGDILTEEKSMFSRFFENIYSTLNN